MKHEWFSRFPAPPALPSLEFGVSSPGGIGVKFSRISVDSWWIFFVLVALAVFFMGFIFRFFFTNRESFNDQNTTYTYTPKKVDRLRTPSLEFSINDFMREAVEVPEYMKIYKELVAPAPEKGSKPEEKKGSKPATATATATTGEYRIPETDLAIYKKYTRDMIPKETEWMEQKYGSIFDLKPFSGDSPLPIAKYLDSVEKTLRAENKLHNYIKYSTASSFESPYSFSEFSDYFGKLVYKYRSRPTQVEEIKTFLFKLLAPIYMHTKLVDHFLDNPSLYSSPDDALYLMNRTKEALEKTNLEDFPHSMDTHNVYVFSEDTDNKSDTSLTVDSLTLFTMIQLLGNVEKLTVAGACPALAISRKEFAKSFREYLRRKYPNTTTPSILAFLVDDANRPSYPDP